METCVRGFSNTFVPDGKMEVKNLQYIEDSELERTWKTTRRERLKQQEQRIWEEFVKEQDILDNVCKEDPYQFLEQLPESYLKELMEVELEKMKKETEMEEEKEETKEATPPLKSPSLPTVTFVATAESDSGIFHIYAEDKEDEVSGPEDENLNESLESPHTVREAEPPSPPPRAPSPTAHNTPSCSSKSSENVSNMIESSIYLAKVKDIRNKINDELLSIITYMEGQNVSSLEQAELRRLCKRSAEFSARFQRIHIYQLHRQMHDIKRHSSQALPFAKHTQFQSQMVRVVSLHQNILHALQVVQKSFEQTRCLRAGAELVRAVARAVRESAALSRRGAGPQPARAAAPAYCDELMTTCDKVDVAVQEYIDKVANILTNETREVRSKRSSKSSDKNKAKRKLGSLWSKTASKSSKGDAGARLSMYSLDTLRLNTGASSSRDMTQSGGTSKARLTSGNTNCDAKRDANGRLKKSPRMSRRPLMRDPHEGRPKRQTPKDTEIRTMVECVEAPSSHISREASPRLEIRNPVNRTAAYGASGVTPRGTASSARGRGRARGRGGGRRGPGAPSPSPGPAAAAVAAAAGGPSPRATPRKPAFLPKLKPTLSSIRSSETPDQSFQEPPMTLTVHCARKDSPEPRPVHKTVPVQDISAQNVLSIPSSQLQDEESLESKEQERASSKDSRSKVSDLTPTGCDVTRLLRQLCGGDATGNRSDRPVGAKNAQLLCINGTSPRQPSTPQLLRILEETIQKKVPRSIEKKAKVSTDKFRLTFNIPEKTAENLFQYRTKFVQHMLTSSMYANSAVGKPWEMIGSVSDDIIDELLVACCREMEIREIVQELYNCETR